MVTALGPARYCPKPRNLVLTTVLRVVGLSPFSSVAADVFDFIGTAHFVKASDMKRAVILPSVCVLSLRTGSTLAKAPPNQRPKHPPQQQQQAPPPPVGSRAPSAGLGRFLPGHLDRI